MNEPQSILLRAAQDALAEAGRTLRKRGWPVEMRVDHVAIRDTFAVTLSIELPSMPVPIESVPPAPPEVSP